MMGRMINRVKVLIGERATCAKRYLLVLSTRLG